MLDIATVWGSGRSRSPLALDLAAHVRAAVADFAARASPAAR
jgi:hypothetical protein